MGKDSLFVIRPKPHLTFCSRYRRYERQIAVDPISEQVDQLVQSMSSVSLDSSMIALLNSAFTSTVCLRPPMQQLPPTTWRDWFRAFDSFAKTKYGGLGSNPINVFWDKLMSPWVRYAINLCVTTHLNPQNKCLHPELCNLVLHSGVLNIGHRIRVGRYHSSDQQQFSALAENPHNEFIRAAIANEVALIIFNITGEYFEFDENDHDSVQYALAMCSVNSIALTHLTFRHGIALPETYRHDYEKNSSSLTFELIKSLIAQDSRLAFLQ